MNASKLMVGDFVKIKTDDDTFIKVQIRTLEFEIMWANIDDDEACDAISYDDIEPIPLTSEILEKNGFKKIQIHGEKQDDIFQCIDGEIIIEVGIYDPNFILVNYRYETLDGVNSGELSNIVKIDGGKFYLHELQHALKLCGIEKEIVL